MKEQDTHRDFSPDALEYLREEAQKLTESEWQDLSAMIDNTSKEITLEMARSMLYTATHMEEVEQLMFSPYMRRF